MGKGHDVVAAYMGMRSGAPQPMIRRVGRLGGGMERREEGGMEVARVRMYSWQFCEGGFSPLA